MFKLYLLFYFLILMAFSNNKIPYSVFDSKENKFITIEEMIDNFSNINILFIGEYHDHENGHKIENLILEKFFTKNNDLAIALEMFERDVQFILDGYLKNEITENFFLTNSRPWPNYMTDYKPLIEFSKNNNLDVLAMNVPRRYANLVSSGKENILENLPEYEKNFYEFPINAFEGKYKEKFFETMTGSHVPLEKVNRYYRAQCLKDDTMAKSIINYLNKNPNITVITYNGSFHSDEYLGIVEKSKFFNDKIKFKTITIVNDKDININLIKNRADFIIVSE